MFTRYAVEGDRVRYTKIFPTYPFGFSRSTICSYRTRPGIIAEFVARYLFNENVFVVNQLSAVFNPVNGCPVKKPPNASRDTRIRDCSGSVLEFYDIANIQN